MLRRKLERRRFRLGAGEMGFGPFHHFGSVDRRDVIIIYALGLW